MGNVDLCYIPGFQCWILRVIQLGCSAQNLAETKHLKLLLSRKDDTNAGLILVFFHSDKIIEDFLFPKLHNQISFQTN